MTDQNPHKLRVGDKVCPADADPLGEEYDVGVIVSMVGHDVRVRWTRAGVTYRESLEDLVRFVQQDHVF